MSSTDPLRLEAHQHFWRYDAAGYPWIGRNMACLLRDFTPDDLRPLLDQAKFDGCIAVQAQARESETDRLLLLDERFPWIRAVVGWVAMFFFISIMFSTLFAMVVKNLGAHTKRGSSFMIMATAAVAYLLPMGCFVIVEAYTRAPLKNR